MHPRGSVGLSASQKRKSGIGPERAIQAHPALGFGGPHYSGANLLFTPVALEADRTILHDELDAVPALFEARDALANAGACARYNCDESG